jgi:hypothetical protein
MPSPTLRFVRWELPPATSMSAVLPEDMSRRGIYVLEFSDGELYVGQTVSLLARVATHARTWPGEIVAVRFAAVESGDLDAAERDVVARLVQAGSRLRNVDLVALPLRSAALDVLVDPVVQAAWLDGDTGPLSIGDRGRVARQRQRTEANFRCLQAHLEFGNTVAAVAAYLRVCIPWPHVTEGRFWVVTSMPSTARSSAGHRLCALSINNVEVLVIGEVRDDDGGWQPTGFLNLAMEPDIWSEAGDLYSVELGHYDKVGDVQRIEFASPEEVEDLLALPGVAAAARTLAVGLLRKGTSLFGRFHDYHLADAVFAQLDAADA